MPEPTCDVLIIGSGPAGCTAALYAARAGLKTTMLSPTELSGMASRAPIVGNFPGQAGPLPGRELVAKIRQQALDAGAEHILEPVAAVNFYEELKAVFAGPSDYYAPAVVVASGASAPSSRIKGEERFQGRGVCYCSACDGPLYSGQDVIVVGDDQQAAEEALNLAATSRSVCLVSHADELALDENLMKAIEDAPNVRVECGWRLEEIVGEDCVKGASFKDGGDEQILNADGVFLYLKGAAPATEFLMDCLDTDEKGFIVTDELCQTSIEGVYAAGDVRSKQARQMVLAAAEGALAALAAERQVRHRPRIRLDRGEAK